MNRRIIILLTYLLNTFNIFSQRLELTGNYELNKNSSTAFGKIVVKATVQN